MRTYHQPGFGGVAVQTDVAVRVAGLTGFECFTGLGGMGDAPVLGGQGSSRVAVAALGQCECLMQRPAGTGLDLGPAFPVRDYFEAVSLSAAVTVAAGFLGMTREALLDLGSRCLEWMNNSKT